MVDSPIHAHLPTVPTCLPAPCLHLVMGPGHACMLVLASVCQEQIHRDV